MGKSQAMGGSLQTDGVVHMLKSLYLWDVSINGPYYLQNTTENSPQKENAEAVFHKITFGMNWIHRQV